MQSILSPKQMMVVEKKAFALGVSSLLLMEQAARLSHEKLCELLNGIQGKEILYLIGPGNNGGDGLAMARMCQLAGGNPRIFLVEEEPKTPDAKTNLNYVKSLNIPILHRERLQENSTCHFKPDAVVDAVYGTGFHGVLTEATAMVFEIVNSWDVPAFSVDIPSGMDGLSGKVENIAFKADHTFCLGHLKIGVCLTQTPEFVGVLHVLPLGIPSEAYQSLGEGHIISALEPNDLPKFLPFRKRNAHKGDCGRLLLYMGSEGMAGAAAMAAYAALASLRSGAGLVTIACEKNIIPILQTLVPNAMCISIDAAVISPPPYDVFAAGCGLGQSEKIWQNVLSLWKNDKPSVWDADALNMLAKNPIKLGEKAVLTPHPGEAARLLQTGIEEVLENRLFSAKELQSKYGGIVVLKSAVSIIRSYNRVSLNITGSSSLARGGSGDALTGIIAGLLAQKQQKTYFETVQAACLWHGMAGIEAAKQHGIRSALTNEVIDCLGSVI